MTDFKQLVTDYLNGHQVICDEMMCEGGHASDWSHEDGDPFEYKGVDSHGGEGQGSDFYSVILIRNPDNHDEQYHIKFQGWYTSYAGAEFEDWSFVEPKQKTITVYS